MRQVSKLYISSLEDVFDWILFCNAIWLQAYRTSDFVVEWVQFWQWSMDNKWVNQEKPSKNCVVSSENVEFGFPFIKWAYSIETDSASGLSVKPVFSRCFIYVTWFRIYAQS